MQIHFSVFSFFIYKKVVAVCKLLVKGVSSLVVKMSERREGEGKLEMVCKSANCAENCRLNLCDSRTAARAPSWICNPAKPASKEDLNRGERVQFYCDKTSHFYIHIWATNTPYEKVSHFFAVFNKTLIFKCSFLPSSLQEETADFELRHQLTNYSKSILFLLLFCWIKLSDSTFSRANF